jgi:hypothetical protein
MRRRPASKVKATSIFFGARSRESQNLEREDLKRSNQATCSSFLDEAEFPRSNINLTANRQQSMRSVSNPEQYQSVFATAGRTKFQRESCIILKNQSNIMERVPLADIQDVKKSIWDKGQRLSNLISTRNTERESSIGWQIQGTTHVRSRSRKQIS